MKNDRLSESDLELLRQTPEDQLSVERFRAHLLAQGMKPERRRVSPLAWIAAGGWVTAGLAALTLMNRMPKDVLVTPPPAAREAPAPAPIVAGPEPLATNPESSDLGRAPVVATQSVPPVAAPRGPAPTVTRVTAKKIVAYVSPVKPTVVKSEPRSVEKPIVTRKQLESMVAMVDRPRVRASMMRVELRPTNPDLDRAASEVRKSLTQVVTPPKDVVTEDTVKTPHRAEPETIIVLSETDDPGMASVAVEKEVTSGFAVGG